LFFTRASTGKVWEGKMLRSLLVFLGCVFFSFIAVSNFFSSIVSPLLLYSPSFSDGVTWLKAMRIGSYVLENQFRCSIQMCSKKMIGEEKRVRGQAGNERRRLKQN